MTKTDNYVRDDAVWAEMLRLRPQTTANSHTHTAQARKGPRQFLQQWFPNCGTRTSSGSRKPSRWSTNRLSLLFFAKIYIHSYNNNYLSGFVHKFLNFCAPYFPCCFLKMAIILFHHQAIFVSILVFQTFDRIVFGRLSLPEQSGTWWQYGTHQWYTIRGSLGTTVLRNEIRGEIRGGCSEHEKKLLRAEVSVATLFRAQVLSQPARLRLLGITSRLNTGWIVDTVTGVWLSR